VSIDDEDAEMSKHKHQRQAELEDDIEEEVEEDVEQVEEIEEELEEVEEEEEAPVGQQEILILREQLKEEIRRKNAAMAAGTSKASSVNQMIMLPAKDG
jgi:23S rRNA maturation-related 3'-5' exoribonuclease YhaM